MRHSRRFFREPPLFPQYKREVKEKAVREAVKNRGRAGMTFKKLPKGCALRDPGDLTIEMEGCLEE